MRLGGQTGREEEKRIPSRFLQLFFHVSSILVLPHRHPPHHSAVFHPFPSLSFPLSPSRASSLFGLGIRCRVARPLYSLRPFNSIATLFIRWRMSSKDGRRPCRLERHPSTICQRSTSLTYRRKLVPGIDILFPRIRMAGQFFPLSSAPMRGGDIYRNVWESRR